MSEVKTGCEGSYVNIIYSCLRIGAGMVFGHCNTRRACEAYINTNECMSSIMLDEDDDLEEGAFI